MLGIAAGAVLCGMRGYRAISDWAQSLGQKSRERFGSDRNPASASGAGAKGAVTWCPVSTSSAMS
ncbi:MAG: hypothetical protein ABSF71_37680 [Terriglobia bacterium]